MGLGQALSSAVSGLHVTQSALSLVAGNIANAQTPGYVKKTATQTATASGDATLGVRLLSINRELDQYLQRQLRTENAGGAYASTRADFFQRLQGVFGQPGADNALTTVFNNFTAAAQTLSTSPDSSSARYGLLTAGQTLAQQLNGMAADIQGLRSDTESSLSDAVIQANNAMRQIADLNRRLAMSNSQDSTAAALRDQRDAFIDQLSQLMDIKVVQTDQNQVSVFTGSGAQLVGGGVTAAMQFDAKGSLSANALWSADPAKRGTGTIILNSGASSTTDLIAAGAFGSGKIGALLEMRDHVLVDAQAQVDQIAAALASALSDRTIAGSAVSAGAQAGFDVDIGSLKAGNTIALSYTDNTGAQRQITIMRVDDPSVLPLSASATPNPNDKVVGVNFSGGMASIIAQLNSALGSTGMQFANPAGSTLRVLNGGMGAPITVNALSATSTVTSLTGGSGELPFFLDGNASYSGAITALGNQSVGFAGRITINPALLADPSRLVVYQTSPLTQAADATRPNFLLDRLTNGILDFAPQAGVGTVASPFSGTLTSYMQQMLSQQGEAAATADSLNQGQQVVVNSLQQKFADQSGVNIDEEMANLLKLQTAYGANARVMSAVRDMLDQLMRM
jgi:flagellar hook-associated protein 1 FlgK